MSYKYFYDNVNGALGPIRWNLETSKMEVTLDDGASWLEYTGIKGDQGELGPQGIQGIQGIQGPQGVPGAQGETGVDGADGISSYVYIAYASDDHGSNFSAVPASNLEYIAVLVTHFAIEILSASDFSGVIWMKYKGDKGDQGEIGAQGIQGEKGDKGDQGPQGIQGEKGDKGDQGPQGIQGEKGDKGDPGDPASNIITSVNSKTGDVVLSAADVGAELSGAVSSHNASADAHSTLFTAKANEAKAYADAQLALKAELTHTHSAYSLATHDHAGVYSQANHNHDAVYSALAHTHSDYALSTHNHDTAYSAVDHTHDYSSMYAALSHTHSGYSLSTHTHDYTAIFAPIDHSHSNYSLTTHNHDSAYAATDHTHSGYALVTHNHDSEYTLIGHTHDYTSVFSALGHKHDADYVAIVTGKGLSTEDYTTAEKTKLSGIADGAEVNVNADWNAESGDALILNKPAIPSKTSELINDSDFTTAAAVADGYVAKSTGYSLVSDTLITKLSNLPTISSIGTGLSLSNGTLTATGIGGASVPHGCILPFAGAGDVPDGFLLCNGAAVSRTAYADLYTAIGTTYGAGDESTTFNLPDFRGRFLRGYDGTRSAAIGTAQADAFQGHYHATNGTATAQRVVTAGSVVFAGTSFYNYPIKEPIDDGTNGTPRTASETRPCNYAVQYIIKY